MGGLTASRFSPHQSYKLLEQVAGIVRGGGGLGMVLDRGGQHQKIDRPSTPSIVRIDRPPLIGPLFRSKYARVMLLIVNIIPKAIVPFYRAAFRGFHTVPVFPLYLP